MNMIFTDNHVFPFAMFIVYLFFKKPALSNFSQRCEIFDKKRTINEFRRFFLTLILFSHYLYMFYEQKQSKL